jgi:selenide,water dikinase
LFSFFFFSFSFSSQATLESANSKGIFAAGDVCHNLSHPRPKAGVFAVRAGPPLLENIKRSLFREPLEEWIPQDEFLGLIGTGFGHAIGSKGGMALEGNYLWELKDKIDRAWMKGYQELPTMEEMERKQRKQEREQQKKNKKDQHNNRNSNTNPIVPVKAIAELSQPDILSLLQKTKMRCAGCGSKVGQSIITRAFNRLHLLEKQNKKKTKNNNNRENGEEGTIATAMIHSRPEIIAGIGWKYCSFLFLIF